MKLTKINDKEPPIYQCEHDIEMCPFCSNEVIENKEKSEMLDYLIPFLKKELTVEQIELMTVITDPLSRKILAYLAKDEPNQPNVSQEKKH